MTCAIEVNNLSKCFRINHSERRNQGDYQTLRESVSKVARRVWGNLRRGAALGEVEDFWALRDVSFEIRSGDVVGIIGRNGAGKSTLLKILTRITEPTEGRAIIRGRVGSLLEVGTGFHPELSGRENVFLNGSILGMSRKQIRDRYDEIVAFSGVEKFLDTPVKRYSSGMRVRLAFAVAAHLDLEVLLIDEVLAVGDAEFQNRCLKKMNDVATSGRTILFVSHNMQAISTLTSRCVLLSGGKCVALGATNEVIQTYLDDMTSKSEVYVAQPSQDKPTITRVEVHTSDPAHVHRHGEPIEIILEVTTPVAMDHARLSVQVIDMYERPLLHLWCYDSERPMCRTPGVHKVKCRIPHLHLYMGKYSLRVHLAQGADRHLEVVPSVCPFEVVMHFIHRDYGWNPETCVYIEKCEWQIFAPSN